MYKIYVTDALRAFLETETRYFDLINDKPEEERSAGEIINSIVEGLNNL